MSPNPLAPEHLPAYLPGADGSDPLFTAVVVLLIVLLMGLGNLYFKLHAIPEQMAHKHNNTQLQLITVLTILALFTHNNLFWILALLLAVIRFPDLSTPINSIAQSLVRLANALDTKDNYREDETQQVTKDETPPFQKPPAPLEKEA